jgi:hypothetical protein
VGDSCLVGVGRYAAGVLLSWVAAIFLLFSKGRRASEASVSLLRCSIADISFEKKCSRTGPKWRRCHHLLNKLDVLCVRRAVRDCSPSYSSPFLCCLRGSRCFCADPQPFYYFLFADFRLYLSGCPSTCSLTIFSEIFLLSPCFCCSVRRSLRSACGLDSASDCPPA